MVVKANSMKAMMSSMTRARVTEALTAEPVCAWTVMNRWTSCKGLVLASPVSPPALPPTLVAQVFLSAAQARGRRKPGREAAEFGLDEETGKMIIDDASESEENDEAPDEVAGAAYREAITSADGFTRGAGGRVKFNKNTKKRRRAGEDEDVDMMDVDDAQPKHKANKRKTEVKLGHEFKAKVCMQHSFCLASHVIESTESWWRRQKAWRGPLCVLAVIASREKVRTWWSRPDWNC